ncbi:unnamed protein product [Brassica oleracea var. botrytis]
MAMICLRRETSGTLVLYMPTDYLFKESSAFLSPMAKAISP